MKKQTCFRLCRMLLALTLAVCMLTANAGPVLAVTQAEINELKEDASDLKGKRKELEAKLDELADDKAEAIRRKGLLDEQVANTSAQIQNVEAQIAKYAELISQTEA